MKTRYRNIAFLAELLINILVFSVSCAILVGLFGKASQISKQAREETAAANILQTVVETCKAGQLDGIKEELRTLDTPKDGQDGNGNRSFAHIIVCDENWNMLSPSSEDAVYSVWLFENTESTAAGQLCRIDAYAVRGPAVSEDGIAYPGDLLSLRGAEVITSVSTARYLPAPNS